MNIIYMLVLLPIFSFLILSFLKKHVSQNFVITISLSYIFSCFIIVVYLGYLYCNKRYFIVSKKIWTWWSLEDFHINICFVLDNLSLVFLSMIVCVAVLVYIFSIWYMRKEDNFSEFFSNMNFFVANMIILVLSNNFITMYLGWEGVSLCSYLLINFYYLKEHVSLSSIKVFILTKIGDLFLISAILTLYTYYHTLNFYDIQFLIKIHVIQYQSYLNIINVLLLLGAMGKSAQIPLQVWLPKAMVGPTPVSALIHSATMVTAGIYLIIRNHDLFLLTPNILMLLGILGGATLIISSLSATVENDIKRILAYSTMSQLGFIFVAVSIGAWNAAIAHLLTHAIFKALLFLSAGSLIVKCHYEQNIFYMGHQLYKKFPFLYFCFLIGGSSLAAIPFLTSGFYSKGNILYQIYENNHFILFIVSIVSIFLTSLYIFRCILVIFHTKSNMKCCNTSDMSILEYVPLCILLLFSTFLSIYIIPDISIMFPQTSVRNIYDKKIVEIFSSIVIFLGLGISYYLYYRNFYIVNKILNFRLFLFIFKILINGFGIVKLYKMVFFVPYLTVSNMLSKKYFSFLTYFILVLFKKMNVFLLSMENRIISIYIVVFTMVILTCILLIMLFKCL